MTTTNQPNPPAIAGHQQSLELMVSRMTDARRELLRAVQANQLTWHRPPGNSVSRTLWRTAALGRAKAKVVTGEVNWLRSHGLAMLGDSTVHKTTGTTRPVILTDRGRSLLDLLEIDS